MGELVLRDATLEDAAFFADVATALIPERPTDPVVMRYEWEQAWRNWTEARWIALLEGLPVGYAFHSHPRWELVQERYGSVNADLLPECRTRDRLDELLAQMEDRTREDGARILRIRANEDDPLKIGAILARGYREDRRGRRWELDLVAERDRILEMTERTRAEMSRQGVRLLTLADDPDPEKHRKVWRLSEEGTQDVPTTAPHVPEPFEDHMRWVTAPGMRDDWFWIARLGDEVVGCSVLSYPPVRGVVGTEWTATARSVRGRGIARAVKCETLAQAIALGVTRVRTGNDAANDPILHINESMGYRPSVGAIDFLKPA
ncbi:MAG: GNAT family N-acetyltransferase [Candidatus Limnocylindria bacterium]